MMAAAVFAIFITIWFVILWYVGACYTVFVLNSLWSIVGWLDIFWIGTKLYAAFGLAGVANAVVERRRQENSLLLWEKRVRGYSACPS